MNEIARRGVPIQVEELHARAGQNEKGKNERIKGLIPFYRQGLIYHNPATCAPLEAQLMSFPNAKRRDVMDATAYIVEILAKGERFMFPGYAGDGASTEGLPSEIKPYTATQAEKEFESIMSGYDRRTEAPLTNFRIM
jgi:hypothetical protein